MARPLLSAVLLLLLAGVCTNAQDAPKCRFTYHVPVGASIMETLKVDGSSCPAANIVAYQGFSPGFKLDVNGDYTFEAKTIGTKSFAFKASCVLDTKKILCPLGVMTFHVYDPVDAPVAKPSTDAPAPTEPPKRKITCQGTCAHNPWVTSEDTTDRWDTNSGVKRSDGNPVDGMNFALTEDGKLKVASYGYIGNMAARFPTLDPVLRWFSTSILEYAGANNFGFDAQCLEKQSHRGTGDDVWWWNNEKKLEGEPNYFAYHDNSWYQRFGGKHDQCGTFNTDPCQYAPLLTPKAATSDDEPDWSINVNDCETTWTGVFSAQSLLSLRKARGEVVFKRHPDTDVLEGTFYNEAVKPTSWVHPSRGVATSVTEHKVFAKVNTKLSTVASIVGDSVVEGESFDYANVNGNQVYGYNFKLYDKEEEITSVDVSQYYFKAASCEGCQHKHLHCTPQGLAITKRFSHGKPVTGCLNNAFQYELGPAATADCAPKNATYSTSGIRGVSDADEDEKCPNYKNITVRFVAHGTNTAAELGPIERSFTVVVTYASGRTTTIVAQEKPYLSQVVTDVDKFASMSLCRTESTSSPECVGEASENDFGVDDNVLLSVKLPEGVKKSEVETLSLTFANGKAGKKYYLVAPTALASKTATESTVYDWEKDASFLDVKTIAAGSLPADADFAFAFTPGEAMKGPRADVSVKCVVAAEKPITLRGAFTLKKKLTSDVRGTGSSTSASNMALALVAAVVIIGGLALAFDKNARKKVMGLFGHSHSHDGDHGHSHSHGAAKKSPSSPSKPEVESPRVKEKEEEHTAVDVEKPAAAEEEPVEEKKEEQHEKKHKKKGKKGKHQEEKKEEKDVDPLAASDEEELVERGNF